MGNFQRPSLLSRFLTTLCQQNIESWYIHWMTALQLHIPRESLSRVSSYDMTFSLIFQPIGLAIAGPAIAGLGIAKTSLIGGVVVTVAIIVILFEPTIRKLSNAR